MKTAAVICEYNPFHNGHLAQTEALRRRGIDAVVALLGGQFTQRGEAALADKYLRAKAAVASGAVDLVLELPYPYSASPASAFASAGVRIANALGFCDCLAFGCEDAELSALRTGAEALRSDAFRENLKSLRSAKENAAVGSPLLRETALAGLIPDSLLPLLRKPNNILALEYLRAIAELSSPLLPLALPRVGAGHGEEGLAEGTVSSAGALRRELSKAGARRLAPYLPKESLAICENAMETGLAPASLVRAERAVLFALADPPEPLSGYAEAGGGLGEAIRNAAQRSSSLADLYAALPTKRYPASRIRRAVLSCLLGAKAEDQAAPPAFTFLLAANDVGLSLLHKKEDRGIKIITKPAALEAEFSGTRAPELYKRAELLYALCTPAAGAGTDWLKKSPIILSSH